MSLALVRTKWGRCLGPLIYICDVKPNVKQTAAHAQLLALAWAQIFFRSQ